MHAFAPLAASYLDSSALVILGAMMVPIVIIAIVVAIIVLSFRHASLDEVSHYTTMDKRDVARCTVRGVGLVRSATQTGTYINDNPEMLIEIDLIMADGSTVRTSLRHVIPLANLSELTPKQLLAVRYDPADPSCVTGDLDPDPDLAEELVARWNHRIHPSELTAERYMRVLRQGTRRLALVEEARMTGLEGAGEHQLRLTVAIQDGSEGGTRATRVTFVGPKTLAKLGRGRYVPVRYLPGEEDDFLLDLGDAPAKEGDA